MEQQRKLAFGFYSGLMAVIVCLSPLLAVADSTTVLGTPLISHSENERANQPLVLLPIQKESSQGSLSFDLGGSESRKLELQLSKPITLNIENNQRKSSSGVGSVFLDSALSLQLTDSLDITSSLAREERSLHFSHWVVSTARMVYLIKAPSVLRTATLSTRPMY